MDRAATSRRMSAPASAWRLWHEKLGSDEILIQAADRALYQAKEQGKNGCVLASQ